MQMHANQKPPEVWDRTNFRVPKFGPGIRLLGRLFHQICFCCARESLLLTMAKDGLYPARLFELPLLQILFRG